MTATNRLALLVLGLGLILGSVLASEYPFGSKVYPTDSDVGRALNPIGPKAILFWDIGINPAIYDDQDILYLHFGPNPAFGAPIGTIRINDIRLTPYGDKPAGSKVTAADNDAGAAPIIPWLPGGAIYYLDLYGGPNMDLEDPVLVQTGPPPAISAHNAVRLTQSEGALAGTKVQNSDYDFDRAIAVPPLDPATETIGLHPAIEYFDANGNGFYDYRDDVYVHSPANPVGHVRVNDVRLSGPVY